MASNAATRPHESDTGIEPERQSERGIKRWKYFSREQEKKAIKEKNKIRNRKWLVKKVHKYTKQK